MDKYKSLADISTRFDECIGSHTIKQMTDELMAIGQEDKVWAFYDEAGMLDDIPKNYMELTVQEAEDDDNSNDDHVSMILEVANNVLPLFDRPMTPEIEEAIQEDRQSLGLDDD